MAQYIEKDDLVAEITSLKVKYDCGWNCAIDKVLDHIEDIEAREVDLEKESELIANSIMVSVQPNKYGTNIYNTERNDFNHYHLKMAARKGIELGLKAQNYNNKCEDLRDDGICNFATTKLGRTMRCENISCSRRNKAQKGEMI